jgi:two-component system, NarL family, sensor histidine kinase DevS
LDEHRLRRLLDVGRGLASQLDLEVVLREVVEVARELTGARYAALGVLDENRHELERFIYSGIDSELRARIGDLPRGRGVLGELIRDPEPLRLDDISEHPRSYGFPAGHPKMRTFLGVPVVIRGQVFGNLYLAEKRTGRFDDSDEAAVTILAEWAAITIFNARLYTQSEEERTALERAVHALEATTEIVRAVGGETDPGLVLETIAKRCRALVHARCVLVLLHDGEGSEIGAVAGECSTELIGETVILGSAGRDDVMRAALDAGVEARAPLTAPLSFRGGELGMIVALDRLEEGPDFYSEDERLLRAAAASAATAVATVQSVTEQRLRQSLLTAERERAHWARELHDSTLQGLGSRRLLLASALKQGEPEQLREAVHDVVEELARDIDELRTLITELRPATLDQIGLVAALEDLSERVAGVAGIELNTSLSVSGERLDPELETAVYRLVQEALNNVTKHARAATVNLEINERVERLEVLVADDGRGFEADQEHSGFGLVGMRERVALLGGSLEIESQPGLGTRVVAAIPLLPSPGEQPGDLGDEASPADLA